MFWSDWRIGCRPLLRLATVMDLFSLLILAAISDHVMVPQRTVSRPASTRICIHNLLDYKRQILWRTSRSLSWWNKTYKLRRSIALVWVYYVHITDLIKLNKNKKNKQIEAEDKTKQPPWCQIEILIWTQPIYRLVERTSRFRAQSQKCAAGPIILKMK